MVQHEHELTVADRPKVADAGAVQTVVVHPLELRVDVLLGHGKGGVGPLRDVGGVTRAESAGEFRHPRRSGAAAAVPQIGDLAAHLRHLVPGGK